MHSPAFSRRKFIKKGALATASAAFFTQLEARQLQTHEAIAKLAANADGWRHAYGLSPDVQYFNHASIGTIPRVVTDAHIAYLRLCEQNPWYYMWREPWNAQRERLREQMADWLNCASEDLAFTHNTTESFSMLASGLDLRAGDEVVFSSLNHDGASVCWQHHCAERGVKITKFNIPPNRIPEMRRQDFIDAYLESISPATRVLIIPHLDNTFGVRHPITEIAAAARKRGVDFVAVDGAQMVGMLPVNLKESGVDFYATSAHKWLQSPKGLGVLYANARVRERCKPMWVTWGQKRWQGSSRVYEDYGTRNLPALMALQDALQLQVQVEKQRFEYLRSLWSLARARVDASEHLTWAGPRDWQLAGSLYAVGVPGTHAVEIQQKLFSEAGYVMRPFRTAEMNHLRISPNLVNSEAELEQLLARLATGNGGAGN